MSSDSLSAIKSKVETKSIKLTGPKIATSLCSVEIHKNKFIYRDNEWERPVSKSSMEYLDSKLTV